MYSDNDVDELADSIKMSFTQYKNWYKFEGGRAVLDRKRDEDEVLKRKLTETKFYVSEWREKREWLEHNPKENELFKSIIRTTAMIEWGNDTKVEFGSWSVKASNKGIEVEL